MHGRRAKKPKQVRLWHLADIACALHMSAVGGKADMTKLSDWAELTIAALAQFSPLEQHPLSCRNAFTQISSTFVKRCCMWCGAFQAELTTAPSRILHRSSTIRFVASMPSRRS